MVLRVLNVAEKPSAAREIVQVLCHGQQFTSRRSYSQYNQIYEFDTTLSGIRAHMIFTSVSGHLKENNFEDRVRKWNTCDPADLLDRSRSHVIWCVHPEKLDLARTLRDESRRADWLVLWLDCDSEGEKIAEDVRDVCREGKPSIVVKRARFSAMTRTDISRAIGNLGELNETVARMVATRQEIDLRAGAAYTRFLTLQLEKFQLTPGAEKQMISYGPCQFPTLGLVVDRWLRIQNFVSRPFWVFDLILKNCKVPFEWSRKHLFDEYSAMALYELCVEEAEHEDYTVTVTRVEKRMRNRWRPLPLSTVELQKVASRSLRVDSHRAMVVAEALYNKGLISYPRTETDRFDTSYNLKGLIEKQIGHPDWGQFASRLLSPPNQQDSVTFTWPRAGRNDDKAHPPIHPTDSAPSSFESHDHQKVYEYITKRFLASCSIDAIGAETKVEVRAGISEYFSARGLIVEQYGYLEVIHPFEKWTEKDMSVQLLEPNAKLPFESLTLRQSQTQPPPLLQEADLIALMDHHGIGTDATIAEHIKKVLERNYVEKLHGGGFSPTQIGQALVIAHELCQLPLARPHMRAKQEEQLKQIQSSSMQASEVLHNVLSDYKTKFQHLRQNRNTIDVVFQQRFPGATTQSWDTLIPNFSRCGTCRQRMDLKGTSNGVRLPRPRRQSNSRARGRGSSRGRGRTSSHASIRLEGADRALQCNRCNKTLKVPRNGALEASEHECPICNYQVVQITNMTSNAQHTVCPKCMNEPPQDRNTNPEGKTSEFRCFSCTHATCSLAKGSPPGNADVARCPRCDRACVLREASTGTILISCSGGRNVCDFVYFFPRGVVAQVRRAQGTCTRCGSARLNASFEAGAVPHGASSTFVGCVWCDEGYSGALRSMGCERDVPKAPHPGIRGGVGGDARDIEGGGRGRWRGRGQMGRGQVGNRFTR